MPCRTGRRKGPAPSGSGLAGIRRPGRGLVQRHAVEQPLRLRRDEIGLGLLRLLQRQQHLHVSGATERVLPLDRAQGLARRAVGRPRPRIGRLCAR